MFREGRTKAVGKVTCLFPHVSALMQKEIKQATKQQAARSDRPTKKKQWIDRDKYREQQQQLTEIPEKNGEEAMESETTQTSHNSNSH